MGDWKIIYESDVSHDLEGMQTRAAQRSMGRIAHHATSSATIASHYGRASSGNFNNMMGGSSRDFSSKPADMHHNSGLDALTDSLRSAKTKYGPELEGMKEKNRS
eukprot:584755_1